MAELENFDLAHISAVEILTPKFDGLCCKNREA